MYNILVTSKFKKDLKIAIKRGYDIDLINDVVAKLANGENLPPKNKDHLLYGNYFGCRECHIQPDWLLIYKIENDVLALSLMRTGTHSDLF
jgi:mRNA interferase YafQ